ncbi:hypothetical protein CFP71_28220 [Amycolatopsis thailandensis]|uniref:Uncharacterized protein n=1 Tax=Amycolatopsis thailandensis TaxID=589330 RepID=A0A229RUG6_9PSEU|nr:SAM-dependent methyltransferase [Amycolatopsis thailandensis]OXM50318.1 hypothetical protein CFP71_28220 [Amycolatopsis thailandensis]
MPDHTSHPDAPAIPDSGHAWPIVSLAELRVALAGVCQHAEPAAVASAIRGCRPGFDRTIEAEYRARNRVIDWAAGAGIRQFVALRPDLPPLRMVHEVLPPGQGYRVSYLLDDNEPAVRTRIVTTYRLTSGVDWLSSTPGIEQCLRMAHGIRAITLTRPVCVLASTALQHTHDPHTLLNGLWNVLPPGSWVAVNQVLPLASDTPLEPGDPPACPVFERHTRTPLILRTATELDALFGHPHHWDLTTAGPAQLLDTRHHPPPLSTTDSPSALITRIAVRPPRTRSHELMPGTQEHTTS